MAITIEWRREPDRQHTGSAELLGVAGTPFIYVHPQDMADQPRGSCAGWWFYNQQDTTESPVIANKFSTYVMGWMSYAAYLQTRALYQQLGGWTRFAIAAIGNSYRLQASPGEVLGAPVATSIQVSGQGAYKAYMKFDPPPPDDLVLDVTADLWSLGNAEISRGAGIGMGRSILSSGSVFDESGNEVGSARAIAQFAFPKATVQQRNSVTYSLRIAAGTRQLHIGSVITGPGYTISSGASHFSGWAEIAFTVCDADGTVILEPPPESEAGESDSD